MPHKENSVHVSYKWLPDPDQPHVEAKMTALLLTGFRSFHKEVRGFSDKAYARHLEDKTLYVSPDNNSTQLVVHWNRGEYEKQEQWWWNYYWPKEAIRDLPDHEDLFLFGEINAPLLANESFDIQAGMGRIQQNATFETVLKDNINRQKTLLQQAGFQRSRESNLLVLSADQFVVDRIMAKRLDNGEIVCERGKTVIAGYPWFNDAGRSAMIGLPGLLLATKRYDEAKVLLRTFGNLQHNGLIPNRFIEDIQNWEYISADTTLWWAWAIHQYIDATGDGDFAAEQFPNLKLAAESLIAGTDFEMRVDARDGLLACGTTHVESTWMDAKVEDFPITCRSGKPIEVNALWYNFLCILVDLADKLGEDIGYIKDVVHLTETSMQKFWNAEAQCLYDVIEPGHKPTAAPIALCRPNQVIAVSLPFRAFNKIQEKAILTTIDKELLTPYGLRSLAADERGYQGMYGCGFARADQYHRDLSYHQGCVWPWLLGHYCEALINVFGPLPETLAKIQILMQPILHHMVEEACLGSISEIFHGDSPHVPRGCTAQAWSVSEMLRTLSIVTKKSLYAKVH